MLKKLPIWYVLTAALSTLSFLLYLAYHDEGYNNWSWMQDAGSWVFLFIAWNVIFWFFIGIGYALKAIIENKKRPAKSGTLIKPVVNEELL